MKNRSLSRRKFIASSCAGAGLVAAVPAALAAPAAAPGTPGAGPAMPRRPLGKTGWLVSIVGFGGGSRFLSQESEEAVEQMINQAVARGINYFDTAFTYLKAGQRESFRRYAKHLVPAHRKNIRLASKLQDRDAETASRNFDITLEELGTDYLDVLHFHALGTKKDVDQIVAKDGALKFYRKLKEQGAIKAIGITGHAGADVLLDAIERIEPDCVMCPQNPAHSGEFIGTDFARIIPVALQRGIGLIAMKTTGRTTLIGKNSVTAEQLVRYALNLPVAAAVIGMPDVKVINSCATIARTLHPMPEKERKDLETKLAAAGTDASLPYLASGYHDGPCDGWA